MKKIIGLLLIFAIVIASIVIGNPIFRNDNIINCLISVIGIIFPIYTIIKKKKTILDKQSILMLCLCLVSILPLICNTYSSLSGTIYYIFRYISIFIIYIIASYLISEDDKYKEYIKRGIIFSGFILVVFGIDLMTTKISVNFIKAIGIEENLEMETRMYSTFLYPNTLAISISVAYILVLGESLKYKLKYFDIGILSLLFSVMLLTQSRTSLIFFALGLMIYFVCINKENKIKFIKIILINLIFSLIYVVVFNYLRKNGNFVLIWILSIGIILFSNLLGKKIINNEKINKLITIKNFIILGVSVITFFILLTFFKTPLTLFNGKNAQLRTYKEIFNIKPNEIYKIKMQIEAISNTKEDNYKIEFIQRNKFSDELKKDTISVNNCNEEFNLEIKTSDDVNMIELNLIANKTNENTKLTIKSLTINDKEFTLNYKFLPTDIINKLKYLTLSQRSVWERFAFIKDGLNIAKDNILIGTGGDCWKYKQYGVQSYNYYSSEMHSYIIQILMDYGILGCTIFLVLIINSIINIIKLIKNKDDINLSIGIAFLVLFMHSLLDFDMSFLYIMIIFYLLISLLNNKDIRDNKNNMRDTLNKISAITITIILLVISITNLYFNSCEIYTNLTKDKKLEKVRNYKQKTDLENRYIFLLPYDSRYKLERAQYLDLYLDVKEKEISKIEKENMINEEIKLLKEILNQERDNPYLIQNAIKILKISNDKENQEYALRFIEKIFSKHKYNVNKIYYDYMQIYSLICEEKEKLYINKLSEIISNNLEKDIKYIKDYSKCRIRKENSEELIEKIKEGAKCNFQY